MKRSYTQFYALTKGLQLSKEEIILGFTEGRTASLRALSDFEYLELLRSLVKTAPKRSFTPKPGDRQRKKMISIAYEMKWHIPPAPLEGGRPYLMRRLNNWCLKQRYRKMLNDHTPDELNVLCGIFEEKVYKSYLEGLNGSGK